MTISSHKLVSFMDDVIEASITWTGEDEERFPMLKRVRTLARVYKEMLSNTRNWVNQFGEDFSVPREVEDLITVGMLEDVSWHNDSCPSFKIISMPETYLQVDHPDPAKREFIECKRWAIIHRPGGHDSVVLAEGENDAGIPNAIAVAKHNATIDKLTEELPDEW